jgi:RNA polymerase sigma-70 factor, ECF subfamily
METATTPRLALEELAGRIRPKLHRYCARMTGSVIDGEDVLQDALIKAFAALARGESVKTLESWLFRIAHNAALDFLRQRARRDATRADADLETIVDPNSPLEERELVARSLRTFMRLPTVQRSSVILMDVLGYSLDEIGEIIGASLPAVKSALHRGRMRLRELAQEPEDAAPAALEAHQHSLLAAYVDRFNARDFDAVRRMLADEVRLDLVNKTRCAAETRLRITSPTMRASSIGVSEWGWSKAGRQRWFTRSRSREPRRTLSYWIGRAAVWPPSAIFAMRVT